MSWEKVRLGDVADFSNGINFDKSAYADGVKLIGVSNFGDRFFPDYENLSEIKKEAVRQSDYLNDGDIIFVRSNGNKELVGRCMLIQNPSVVVTFSGFCIRARLKDCSKYNPKFFAYHFKSKMFRQAMAGTAVGTNIQNLSQTRLSNYEALIPDYEVQLQIAEILSAYDDLIENNQKQIKLLEEAAQRLYKEWFVDFRFPGYEETRIVGGIPEGWVQTTLGQIDCRLESGSRPKGGIDGSLTDGIPSVGAENVLGLGRYNYVSEKLVTKEFFKKMKRGQIKDRDILIYKDGAYIGRTSLFQDGFPHAVAAVNEHVFLLHTVDETLQYFLFFMLYQKEYFSKMQKLNKNSAQPGINQKALMMLDVTLPSYEIIEKFNEFVEPLMKSIFSKAKQNHYIVEIRDRMLSKLMNGEFER